MSPQRTQPAWRTPLLVKTTYAVHATAGGAMLLNPELWPWSAGALAVNHGCLAGAGLSPRSTWLGPNWRRLPPEAAARGEIAITIDDGPDPEVTPRVLELLHARKATATFFCIGERASAQPALCRAIIDAGHAVENHTQRHQHNFSFLGPRGFRAELTAAQETFFALTGKKPRFFRAPAGLRNMFLGPVLHDLDLQLASWTKRGYDTRVGDPALVLQRLEHNLMAGDILLLHDGNAARTVGGTPVILDVLPRLLDSCAAKNLKPVTLASALP